MSFEAKLSEVFKNYERVASESFNIKRELFVRELQARDVVFLEDSVKMILPAPALQRMHNVEGMFVESKVSYVSKTGRAISHLYNGLIELYIKEKSVVINFVPRLPLPEEWVVDRVKWEGSFNSPLGELSVSFESGEGKYLRKGPEGKKDFLNIVLTNSNIGVAYVELNKKIVGAGVLTSFFKDFKYEGLDDLR